MVSKHPSKARKFAWANLPDQELLQLRLKDLASGSRAPGWRIGSPTSTRSWTRRGFRIRPHFWVSSEWFSSTITPGIAVPFYLTHPRLERLERKMILEAEGSTPAECMRILRHEMGHVIQHAYQLQRRRRWQQLFGPSSRRYPRHYRANPTSRNYVQHLRLWYAQSHPDEDFAETFAVWLQPRSNWRKRYAGWPALKKLEYVDELMSEIADQKPLLTTPQACRSVEPLDGDAGGALPQEAQALSDRGAEDLRPRSAAHLLRRSAPPPLAGGLDVHHAPPRARAPAGFALDRRIPAHARCGARRDDRAHAAN